MPLRGRESLLHTCIIKLIYKITSIVMGEVRTEFKFLDVKPFSPKLGA